LLFGDLEAERIAMERTIAVWRATHNNPSTTTNNDTPTNSASNHQQQRDTTYNPEMMTPSTPMVLTDKLSRADALVQLGLHHDDINYGNDHRVSDVPSTHFVLTIGHPHTMTKETHPRTFAGVVERYTRRAAEFFAVSPGTSSHT
jgi:zona occludens toxin (predicted ATPase)